MGELAIDTGGESKWEALPAPSSFSLPLAASKQASVPQRCGGSCHFFCFLYCVFFFLSTVFGPKPSLFYSSFTLLVASNGTTLGNEVSSGFRL